MASTGRGASTSRSCPRLERDGRELRLPPFARSRPATTASRSRSRCPASRRERSSSSVASFSSRVHLLAHRWSGTRAASPRPAPRRRAARGSRPSENTGVRSSCDAFAMNSRRAWSSCASRRRMRSKARASSPTSSCPRSMTGSSNMPSAIRSAARSSRRIRRANIHDARVADDEHEREHDAAGDQQPPLDEAHVAEGARRARRTAAAPSRRRPTGTATSAKRSPSRVTVPLAG